MASFNFKYFSVQQDHSALKVGTDALLLGSLCNQSGSEILDVGTGTGVIALMLAQRFGNARITGVEKDRGSCDDAHENFERSPWSDRLSLITGDFFELDTPSKYDWVISNPPFYATQNEGDDLRDAQAKHMRFSRSEFLEKTFSILKENGTCTLIIPSEDVDEWIEDAKHHKFCLIRRIDIEGKPGRSTRCIVSFSSTPKEFEIEKFVVRDEDGKYSDQYKKATIEFHDRQL